MNLKNNKLIKKIKQVIDGKDSQQTITVMQHEDSSMIKEEITQNNSNIKVRLKNITLQDDSIIEFKENQITIFVGANNVGKSEILREINNFSKKETLIHRIIKDHSLTKKGDSKDLHNLLSERSKLVLKYGNMLYYEGLEYSICNQDVDICWERSKVLSDLHPFFVKLLTTSDRLNISNPPQSIAITKEVPKHPIHNLQIDNNIEQQFSDYLNQAFGMSLIVHHCAGSEVPLYVGKKPDLEGDDDRASMRYLEQLEQLPLLHEQGDGMKSFIGVLLGSFISHHQIVLIDEPEAFLHPPHARLLGKMLVNDLPTNRQLFIATHSIDFLKGVLDTNYNNVEIIRVNRDGNTNKLTRLNNDDLKSLWSDSLVRYSNILNGLFHSKVIVCEGDADCVFYSTILQSLYDETKEVNPDYLFIHCGGKQKLPIVIKALRKLDVKFCSILDFDVLNETNPLKDIFTNSGGNWEDIKIDFNLVKKAVDDKKPELTTKDLQQSLIPLINNVSDIYFPSQNIKDIRSLLKKTSSWDGAKKSGLRHVPHGKAYQSCVKIIEKCKNVGLFIVPIGELECFDGSIGGHGTKWVNEALKTDISDPEIFKEAKEFVRLIDKF